MTVGYASGVIPRIPLNLVLLKGIQILGFQFIDFATHRPDELVRNERELLELLAAGRVVAAHRRHVRARRRRRRAALRRRRQGDRQGRARRPRRGEEAPMNASLDTVELAADTVGLLEGLTTTRAIRRYTDDPIPEPRCRDILFAATRAPSGSNRQPFRFLVLRDSETARRGQAAAR